MLKHAGWFTSARGRGVAALLGLLFLLCTAPMALANSPLGACCLNDGSCSDLFAFQCDDAGGDFIGDMTACANINCRAPVPMLSAAGVVMALGALIGLGVHRVSARRRR